jgi:hypothetical protein
VHPDRSLLPSAHICSFRTHKSQCRPVNRNSPDWTAARYIRRCHQLTTIFSKHSLLSCFPLTLPGYSHPAIEVLAHVLPVPTGWEVCRVCGRCNWDPRYAVSGCVLSKDARQCCDLLFKGQWSATSDIRSRVSGQQTANDEAKYPRRTQNSLREGAGISLRLSCPSTQARGTCSQHLITNLLCRFRLQNTKIG